MIKIIWIIGCPRSGTSFLTDYIGNYTDYCFNEPWNDFPLGKHKDWMLPKHNVVLKGIKQLNTSVVFKYCANALYYDEISKLYPKSKWVCIVRDPLHVMYSIFYPKKDSVPKRLWEVSKNGVPHCPLAVPFRDHHLINEVIRQVFFNWHSIFVASMKIEEIKLIKYENIDIEGLADFLELPLSRDNFIYNNRNEVYDIEKMKYLIKFLKFNNLYDDILKVKKILRYKK